MSLRFSRIEGFYNTVYKKNVFKMSIYSNRASNICFVRSKVKFTFMFLQFSEEEVERTIMGCKRLYKCCINFQRMSCAMPGHVEDSPGSLCIVTCQPHEKENTNQQCNQLLSAHSSNLNRRGDETVQTRFQQQFNGHQSVCHNNAT